MATIPHDVDVVTQHVALSSAADLILEAGRAPSNGVFARVVDYQGQVLLRNDFPLGEFLWSEVLVAGWAQDGTDFLVVCGYEDMGSEDWTARRIAFPGGAELARLEGEGKVDDAAPLAGGGLVVTGWRNVPRELEPTVPHEYPPKPVYRRDWWLQAVDGDGARITLEGEPPGNVLATACASNGDVAFLVPSSGGSPGNPDREVTLWHLVAGAAGSAWPRRLDTPGTSRISFSPDGRYLLLDADAALLPQGGTPIPVRGHRWLAAAGRCVTGVEHNGRTVNILRSEQALVLPWASFDVYEKITAKPGVAERANRADVALILASQTQVLRLRDPDELDLVADDAARRRHGVEAAGRLPADRAVPVLVDVLEAAMSPDRDGAAAALAAFGAPGVSELIRFSGRTDDDRVQAIIAAALGSAPDDPHEGNGTPVDQVVNQAVEQGGENRLGAVRLAGYLPWLDVREELHAGVTDTDADVRAASARSLGQRRDTTAAPALLSATTDSDARVAAAAATALCDLAGMPLPVGSDATGRDFVGRVLANGLPKRADDERFADDEGFSSLSSLLLDARGPFDDLLQALARYTNREPYAGAGRALSAVLGDALTTQSPTPAPADALSVLMLALPADPTEDRGPALTWDTHRRMARIAEPSDPERAARHYEEAIATIDRMWGQLLGDPTDADFFRDKADLYDAALLSAVRLGRSARAVEILEKAKTRYLGDLIARRSPRARTLARTERDYWRYVGDGSVPPDAAWARAGGGADAEIVGVAPTLHRSNVVYVPARLGVLLRQADDSTGDSAWMIGSVWAWIGTLQRQAVPTGAGTAVGQALRAVLDVLREIRTATASGLRAPLPPARAAALSDAYTTATEALHSLPYPNNDDNLWEGRRWLDEYLATPAGAGQLVLDAVEEAVGFLIAGTPVQAVRYEAAELPTGQFTDLPAFDIGRRRRTTEDATDTAGAAPPPYTLERERAWEFVEQIVRGRSVGYNHALKIVRDDPSTAVLQFATTPEGTVVFATVAADAPARAITGAEDWRGPALFTNRNVTTSELAKQLGNASAGWHHAYQHRNTDKGKSWRKKTDYLIEWLHSELFTPLLPWLRARAVKRLVIVPHRELHQIPVQAWCTPRYGGRRYVLDSFDICHVPSLTIRSICSARSRERTDPVTTVAAILDPKGDLPLARTELAGLHVDATPLKPPTWERWVKASVTADMCHYGGHGRYLPRAPLESSLDLDSGRVELGELFGGGFLLPRVQLVTLMGCETAMTADSQDKADEHLGLASGFVFAGAPAVLSTLWVVDEVAAAMLVRRYYEHIMTGMRPSAALGHAQRWLRDDVRHATVRRFLAQTRTILERDGTLDSALGKLEKYRDKYARPGRHPLERPFAHPIFWAPFIVSGVDTAVML